MTEMSIRSLNSCPNWWFASLRRRRMLDASRNGYPYLANSPIFGYTTYTKIRYLPITNNGVGRSLRQPLTRHLTTSVVRRVRTAAQVPRGMVFVPLEQKKAEVALLARVSSLSIAKNESRSGFKPWREKVVLRRRGKPFPPKAPTTSKNPARGIF